MLAVNFIYTRVLQLVWSSMLMKTEITANDLVDRITMLGRQLSSQSLWLATAESCTGGGIGQSLTDIAGSSQWYRGGVIAYCNQLKQQLLGLDAEILLQHGAVSQAVVEAMAVGVCNCCDADLAISVSGIAGPDGGSVDKPVGLVWLAWADRGRLTSRACQFSGDRQAIRTAALVTAVSGLLDLLVNR
jgi:nicotinamide-nucleotide amidase